MLNEEIPAILGEGIICDASNADEVGFDILNCSFCRVLSVIAWGSQLVFKVVFPDCIYEYFGDFIVQSEEVCLESLV